MSKKIETAGELAALLLKHPDMKVFVGHHRVDGALFDIDSVDYDEDSGGCAILRCAPLVSEILSRKDIRMSFTFRNAEGTGFHKFTVDSVKKTDGCLPDYGCSAIPFFALAIYNHDAGEFRKINLPYEDIPEESKHCKDMGELVAIIADSDELQPALIGICKKFLKARALNA